MIKKHSLYLCLVILLNGLYMPSQAQEKERFSDKPFFYKAKEPDPKRIALVTGTIGLSYGGALVALNEYWYKEYERSGFHFFNDAKEWHGMDKAGHVFNSYYQSRFAVGMYRWTGIDDKKAIWIGGMTGTFLQSSIEVMDGFSTKWGASVYDFGANMLGSALVIAQELTWKEQRIVVKISAWPQDYPADLEERANELFGQTFAETVVKDYNAITLWSSLNISSFIKKEDSKFPKWLNVAVGYGAGGLYGGFENRWCSDPAGVEFDDNRCNHVIDRTDVTRYSQFYLSFDVDFTRIKTRNPFLHSLFAVVNLIKIPAPALEVNTKGEVRFHPVFF